MEKQKKETRGGARAGAGRKPSGIETVSIAFRVPAEKADVLKEKIAVLIRRETKRPA